MGRRYLTDDDVDILNEALRIIGVRRQNKPITDNEHVPSGPLFWQTPSGGIPARTGTSSPYTPGKAVCKLCHVYETSTADVLEIRLSDPLIERYVYNSEADAIAGTVLIQSKKVGRFDFVDVGECS
jgi:hypothetical protein